MRSSYLDLDHGQLHFRSNLASSDKHRQLPPLLLLHQSPSDSQMYLALAAELENDFWLIAPDSRGFGMSDALPDGFSLQACAAAIKSLLLHLGVESGYLFGHHTGASVGVQLASANPGLFEKVALCGPTLLSPELQAALPGLGSSFAPAADGSHLEKMWQRMSGKEGDTPASILQREVNCAFAAGESYPQAYAAVAEQPFESQLRSLETPVLVFVGDRDVLYPQLDASYACLQQGSKAVVADAGSYICDRYPAEVASLLRRFFLDG